MRSTTRTALAAMAACVALMAGEAMAGHRDRCQPMGRVVNPYSSGASYGLGGGHVPAMVDYPVTTYPVTLPTAPVGVCGRRISPYHPAGGIIAPLRRPVVPGAGFFSVDDAIPFGHSPQSGLLYPPGTGSPVQEIPFYSRPATILFYSRPATILPADRFVPAGLPSRRYVPLSSSWRNMSVDFNGGGTDSTVNSPFYR